MAARILISAENDTAKLRNEFHIQKNLAGAFHDFAYTCVDRETFIYLQ